MYNKLHLTYTEIGKIVGKDRTTISRDIKRGLVKNLTSELIEIYVYNAENENVSVNALIRNETLWLTQEAMAELFNVDRSSITKHLNNIFREGELDEKVVCEKIAHTTKHGFIEDKTQIKEIKFYNLENTKLYLIIIKEKYLIIWLKVKLTMNTKYLIKSKK